MWYLFHSLKNFDSQARTQKTFLSTFYRYTFLYKLQHVKNNLTSVTVVETGGFEELHFSKVHLNKLSHRIMEPTLLVRTVHLLILDIK